MADLRHTLDDQRLAGIRLAVFDVDGVMTDGSITLGADGSEQKTFNVRDGYGLVSLLRAGIAVGVITGRSSRATACRMRELGIEHLYQGVTDKRACLELLLRKLDIPAQAACYMGDDLPDVPAMRHAGLAVAVADAAHEVRATAAAITACAGGRGAVRELCDALLAVRSGASAGHDRGGQ